VETLHPGAPAYQSPPGHPGARPDAAPSAARSGVPIPLKVVVAGGFGVGKTTFVGACSDIPPLTTEAHLTAMSSGIDDISQIAGKTTTTVALDFGRLSIDDQLTLYVFGTPGQERFWFMWDDLCFGAVGAIALVDVRRLAESFAAIDYFEHRRVPFVVAVNEFPGHEAFTDIQLRQALAVRADVPLFRTDARSRRSAVDGLIRLVQHAIATE
jgi:uncharacterized protein